MKPKAYSYVRFSTPEQLKGDSQRRQYQLSEDYAAKHGLDLVEESFVDLGVSAYRGKNAKEGAFADFLAAIKEGKIKSGSYLLVESLDRISRESPFDALSSFISIIKQGITIVTLLDNCVYSYDAINGGGRSELLLFSSIMVMARAHEESRVKSQRITAYWDNRRRNAAKQPLTTIAPSWLVWKEDHWEKVPERVKLIEEMFKLKIAGKGKYHIQRLFNNRGETTWNDRRTKSKQENRPSIWHHSYIGRILESRQVIGEFQPHQRVNGKRVPFGEPIPGYYPKIISDKIFAAANGVAKGKPGRYSWKEKNLFTHTAYCHCGCPMHFADKGDGYRYLVCSRARFGKGCRYVNWRYDEFERSFVTWIRGIPLTSIFDEQTQKRIASLQMEVDQLNGEKGQLDKFIDRLVTAIESGDGNGPPTRLVQRISELEAKRGPLAKLLESKVAELSTQKSNGLTHERDTARFVSLLDKLKEVDARKSFKREIGRRFRRIVMYPDKAPVNSQLRAKLIEQITLNCDSSEGVRGIINNPLYQVFFRNGKMWNVIPNPEDPEAPPLMMTNAIDMDAVQEDPETAGMEVTEADWERVATITPTDAQKSLEEGRACIEEIKEKLGREGGDATGGE